jgi:hypothetical protein
MFATTDILLKLILAGCLGYLCALLNYLIDYCFWQGSIFKNWLPWLAKVLVKFFKPKEYKDILLLEASAQANNLIAEAEGIFFYKVLGGCSVCTNVWLCFITWAIIFPLTFFEWYYLFPYLLVSSFYIRKFVGAVYGNK